MGRHAIRIVLAGGLALLPAYATADPFGSRESTGADRQAIEQLLHSYTTAVSTKNEAAFETLLLNQQIPFSGVDALTQPGARDVETRNYPDFRRGVFGGPPFTQSFQDVHILQDGPLAEVSLVFVNRNAAGQGGWGWKTLQLLKLDGKWKIASEFYTGHPLPAGK